VSAFFVYVEDELDSNNQAETMDRINSEVAKQEVKSPPPAVPPPSSPDGAEVDAGLLDAHGAVAGITLAQSIWRVVSLTVGAFAIAVPVGAIAGAVGGGLVGQIARPHLLVLIMAMLAGWSVGGLCGGYAWAETGQLAGRFTGSLVGAFIWAAWFLNRRIDEIQ
jgi:hypothetical protein